MHTIDDFQQRIVGCFPAHLGLRFTSADPAAVRVECPVAPFLMAPNGYMHGGAVVSIADTCAGFACFANLPHTAVGYTTVELKSNFLGTASDGTIDAVATAVHLGRSTHVWDVMVSHRESQRTIAVFRCTQMLLYSKGA